MSDTGSFLRKFISNNFWVLILVNSANVFNYLFYFVLGRSLSPDTYGVFNSLNALIAFFAAPMVVIQLTIAKFCSQMERVDTGLFSKISTMGLGLVASVLVGIAFLFLPTIASFLKMEGHEIAIAIMLVVFGGTIMLSVPLGLLQGLRRFKAFGRLNVILSVTRFILVLILVWGIGFCVKGAATSVLLAIILTLFMGYYHLKDISVVPGTRLQDGLFKKMIRYSVPTMVSTGIIMGFFNLDIVMVRYYCEPFDSGMYAAASVLGHVAYVLPAVLVTVLFPEVAYSQNAGETSRRVFVLSFLMTAALSFLVVIVCLFFSEELLVLTYGAKYAGASQLLIYISIAMIGLVLTNVFVIFGMAQSDFKFLWSLIFGMILFLVQVSCWHEFPLDIARALIISSFTMLAGCFLWRSKQIYSSLVDIYRHHGLDH